MYILGESISSVVFRASERISPIDLTETQKIELAHVVAARLGQEDIDYGYDNVLLRTISDLLDVEYTTLEEISQCLYPQLMLASEERVQFCAACVLEDLKVTRTAVWRLKWGYSHFTVCEKHACAMRVLKHCRNPSYRAPLAAKEVITDAISSGVRENEAGEVARSGGLNMLTKLLISFAKDVQDEVMTWPYNSKDMRANLFGMFFTVFLRAHRKRIDAPPYCYQLASNLRKNYCAPVADYDAPIDSLFYGHTIATDPYARMIAVLASGVMLDISEARENWLEVAHVFSAVGILVPASVSWLFTSCTGNEEQGVRSWLYENIARSTWERKNNLLQDLSGYS